MSVTGVNGMCIHHIILALSSLMTIPIAHSNFAHLYVRHKSSATKNEKILEDNIGCAYPNVDIAFRIFLTH